MALSTAGSLPRTLIAVDLTRFVCAMLVVAFHYSGFVATHAPAVEDIHTAWTSGSPWRDAAEGGWIGVELFFVLSGFVIAWSAEGSRAGAFLWRRARRLLPAAWLCSSITAAALLIQGSLPADAILHRWLASALFDPLGTPIDPSYWTLAIEVNFYIGIALVLRGGGSAARIERFAVALGCASLTYWIASLTLDLLPMQNRLAQLTLLPHGCFFALGALVRAQQRDGARVARSLAMLAFGLAGAIEVVVHGREFAATYAAVGFALAMLGAGLAAILFAERVQPWLARRIAIRTAVALGLTTYPLYLLHQLLGRLGIDALVGAGWSLWPAVAATLGGTLALAWLVARYGEPAIRTRLSAITPRRDPVPDNRSSAFPSAG